MPRCKHCSDKFTPLRFNWKYCDKEECTDIGIKELREKDRKQRKKKARDHTKQLKSKLDNMKRLPELKKELQPLINHIARLIDWGTPCMMCGEHIKNFAHGCHYHTTRAHDQIRFNLHNIHHGDFGCNNAMGGNIQGYDQRLIEVYSKEYWEYVKFQLIHDYPYCGLRKEDIEPLKKEARKIIKELKTIGMSYTVQMRVKLRTKYNERLGVYLNNIKY